MVRASQPLDHPRFTELEEIYCNMTGFNQLSLSPPARSNANVLPGTSGGSAVYSTKDQTAAMVSQITDATEAVRQQQERTSTSNRDTSHDRNGCRDEYTNRNYNSPQHGHQVEYRDSPTSRQCTESKSYVSQPSQSAYTCGPNKNEHVTAYVHRGADMSPPSGRQHAYNQPVVNVPFDLNSSQAALCFLVVWSILQDFMFRFVFNQLYFVTLCVLSQGYHVWPQHQKC